MEKKASRIVIVLFSILLFAAISLYCSVAYYYKDGFSYGTYINGISATGKTIDQLNSELLSGVGDYEGLTVTVGNGKSYNIAASDVDLKYNYRENLKEALNSQHAMLWGLNFLGHRNISVTPVISYSNTMFAENVDNLPFFTHYPEERRTVEIVKTLNHGYELINMRRNVLNEDYAKSLIAESFNNFDTSLDLVDSECYRDLPLSEQNVKDIELFDKIDAFQNRNITFLFGDDKETIDRSVAYKFIKVDNAGNFKLDLSGNPILDKDALNEYVDSLAEKYDTFETPRKFKTTDGRIVSVEGGNYGNKLDTDAEKEYLYNAFVNNINEEHNPAYLHEAPIKGSNDLGDTYIEIDLTKQRMYYYEKGIQKVATDIVSGCLSNGHSTIRGTYFIYNHRRNTTLIGPNYASFVRYWLGIYKGYGIHDASWRNKFGGEIYKTSGSHGCVNTPYENIKTMWESVEDGTPCVVFY